MNKPIRKAVLPVAGLGTRFLPATKAIPKEMLTVVDRPLIQYAFEEAKAAGIEQFYFVTGRAKSAIEDHFDVAYEMEATLRERGKDQQLAEMASWLPTAGQVAYTRQQRPLPYWKIIREGAIEEKEIAGIITVDDLMVCDPPCLKQMVDAYEETGGNVVAVVEVPREQTSRYGVLDIIEDQGRLVRAKGVVEKPSPAEAPSNLTIIGRYIIQPEVFGHLETLRPGAGNEIQFLEPPQKIPSLAISGLQCRAAFNFGQAV